jgi:hypothetical protein
MEQRPRSRDVVSFGGLAPRGAIVRAPGNNDGQAQSHAQRETSLFVLVGSAHDSRHDLFIAPNFRSTRSRSISPLRRFWLVPFVKALAAFLAELSFTDHTPEYLRRAKRFRAQLSVQVFGNIQAHI